MTHRRGAGYEPVPQATHGDVDRPPCAGYRELQDCAGLLVKQEVEVMEALTGFETENKYAVYSRANGTPALCEHDLCLYRLVICNNTASFRLCRAELSAIPNVPWHPKAF
jgi:hypothetical protein